jgi:hypothetical protein
MIKMGARMMQTPGSFGVALGAGLEQYADTLQAANKQTAEIAGNQTKSKLEDAQARKNIADANTLVAKSSSGIISTAPNAKGSMDLSLTSAPNEPGTVPFGGAAKKGEIGPGSAESPGGTFKKPEEIAKNFDVGTIYADDPKDAQDRFSILQKLQNKDPSVTPSMDNKITNDVPWRENFAKVKSEAEALNQGARAGTTSLGYYATALANTPANGELTTGFGAEKRYAIGNAIETTIRGFGVTDDDLRKVGVDPDRIRKINDARTAQIEMKKIGNELTRLKNPSSTVAVAWLKDTADSLPNVENTPKANAALLGALYAGRKQAMDNYNTIVKIGNATNESGYGKTSQLVQQINPSKNYQRDARMVAELVNPENADKYAKDIKMPNGKVERHNVVSAYNAGLIPVDKMDAFLLDEFKVHNGSRIFQ